MDVHLDGGFMGTYFVLTEQINQLADKLEREGKLDELFTKAHISSCTAMEGGTKAPVKVQVGK
jgi:uncharacterized membrane protein YqgA involved in biofilm formation